MKITSKKNFKTQLTRILFYFAGDSDNYTLKQQILNVSLFLFTSIVLLGFTLNIFAGYPVELNIALSVIALILIALYYFARKKKNIKIIAAVFYLSMLLLSFLAYFFNGGLFGSTIYFYLPVLSYIIINGEKREQKFLLLACIILIVVIQLKYYHPELVVPVKNKWHQFTDISLSIFINIFLIIFIVYSSKKLYQQERKNTWNIIEQYRKNSFVLKSTLNGKVSLLSVREREIFRLIIESNSNKEIANKLNISIGTVKNHITSIYKKLDVNKRIDILNEIE